MSNHPKLAVEIIDKEALGGLHIQRESKGGKNAIGSIGITLVTMARSGVLPRRVN